MLQFENLESRREIIVADPFRMVGAVVQDRTTDSSVVAARLLEMTKLFQVPEGCGCKAC